MFTLSKVMGDTFEYLVYIVNIRRRKDKYKRSYGDVNFEIEFTKACSGKLVISLSRVDILRIEVEDMDQWLSLLVIILHVRKVIQVARWKIYVIAKLMCF